MTGAQKRVADIFEKAYRGAGGQGDARSTLELRVPPIPHGNGGRSTFRRLHADEGIGHVELSANVENRARDGIHRLPKSDLSLLAIAGASLARAERRRDAIGRATSEVDPIWSMTAHPVVKAAVELFGIPLIPARLGDATLRQMGDSSQADAIKGYEFDEANASIRLVAGQLWAAQIGERRTGLSISQNNGRFLCRVVLLDVSIPHTVAMAMRGRPLREALSHPLTDMLPDLRIHRLLSPDVRNPDDTGLMTRFAAKMNKRPRTIIEVMARPVALASAPDDVDVSWRGLPALHYAEIQ